MSRGGKRPGAGGPRGHRTRMPATSVRLAAELLARVAALRATSHEYTLPDIVRAGVAALEALESRQR